MLPQNVVEIFAAVRVGHEQAPRRQKAPDELGGETLTGRIVVDGNDEPLDAVEAMLVVP